MPPIRNDFCTIYLLTNTARTDVRKLYIGQTWYNPEDRMGKDGIKYKNSVFLYAAILKYGVVKFKYTELSKCLTEEKANDLEKK